MRLKLSASERSSVGPSAGTRRVRSWSSATLDVIARRRPSGRSASDVTSHTSTDVAARASSAEQQRGAGAAPTRATPAT